MEVILTIVALMGGTIFVLLTKLSRVKSDKKLEDVKIEDIKLEEKQARVQEEKTKLKKELKKIDTQKSDDLTDSEIERYWKDRKE